MASFALEQEMSADAQHRLQQRAWRSPAAKTKVCLVAVRRSTSHGQASLKSAKGESTQVIGVLIVRFVRERAYFATSASGDSGNKILLMKHPLNNVNDVVISNVVTVTNSYCCIASCSIDFYALQMSC